MAASTIAATPSAAPRRGASKRRIDPNDPRYPRTGPIFAVRWVLQRAWLGFLAYLLYVAGQLGPLIINGQPITPDDVAQALLVERILPFIQQRQLSLIAWAAPVGLLLLVVLAGRVAHQDYLYEQVVLKERDAFKELVPVYTLKPVSQLDPKRDEQVNLAHYVEKVYLPRREKGSTDSADDHACAELKAALVAPPSSDSPLGIMVIGRPALGKTRCAWEAMRASLRDATFVSWPHGDAPVFNFSLVESQTVVLWLDNLQDYANDREAPTLNALPGRFSASRLVIVATSRDGEDLDKVEATLQSLQRRLTPIILEDITHQESVELADALELAGEQVDRTAEDGTPGALSLNVAGMRGRYQALGDKSPEHAILKTMKLLRSAGTYDYPAARVQAVATKIRALPDDRGTWQNAVDVLVKQDFVRLGPLDGKDHLHALVPLADVYLERAVNDYPLEGSHLSDDWEELANVLIDTHDANALFDLGYTANLLRSGLDGARPWDLLSARQLAVRCYLAYLDLAPAENAGRPAALNNLGNALRAQAGLATDGAEQGRLLAGAEAAFRAALAATTPGTLFWATFQSNLGIALAGQAELATDGEERWRLLGEAAAAHRAALSASMPGTYEWATFQSGLGTALAAQAELVKGEEESRRLLAGAEAAFRAALSVRQRIPLWTWASYQSNLGTALFDQAGLATGEEQQRLLGESEESLRAALAATTEDTPDWAVRQSNLSDTLAAQAGLATGEEQRHLLAEVVVAARAALAASAPGMRYWATYQSNLGIALAAQAKVATGEEQRRLLGDAEVAFRAALAATTEDTPDWAVRQNNLAVFYLKRAESIDNAAAACADLREALRCVGLADGVFAQGNPTLHQRAMELRQIIGAAQRERGCEA